MKKSSCKSLLPVLLAVFILINPSRLFSQNTADTLIVKGKEWVLTGKVLTYDDRIVSFKPSGYSKVRDVKRSMLEEIRFADGKVVSFIKKVEEIVDKPEVAAVPDTNKIEIKPVNEKKEVFVTNIFDDFILYLSSGELVQLYGLKHIEMMDSKRPPEYIKYQTDLYVLQNIGGRIVRVEEVNRKEPINEVNIYIDNDVNFNKKIIADGYAKPEPESEFYISDIIDSFESARENKLGIWGAEGIDLNLLARQAAAQNVQTEEEEDSETTGNPMMNLLQNVMGKFKIPGLNISADDFRVKGNMPNTYTESLKYLGLDKVKDLPQSTMKDIMKAEGIKGPDQKKGMGKGKKK